MSICNRHLRHGKTLALASCLVAGMTCGAQAQAASSLQFSGVPILPPQLPAAPAPLSPNPGGSFIAPSPPLPAPPLNSELLPSSQPAPASAEAAEIKDDATPPSVALDDRALDRVR